MNIRDLLNVEETSGFFSNPSAPESGEISSRMLIHTSSGGAFCLFRIERQGKFRVLKCLKEEYRGDALYVGLLRKEFEIGSSLDHPNICRYYSFTQLDDLGNCIEMEWVHGRTLGQALKKSAFSRAEGDRIIEELCEALSFLHSRQILHRDLTPSNVMLTASGNNVKLIDFGFSDSDEFSMLKTPAGTRSFTAPEVLNGRDADIRSEIWSLGVLIGLITGGRRHRSVVRRCCAENPSARYASVSEVRDAIHKRRGWMLWIVLFVILLALSFFLQKRDADSQAGAPAPQRDTVILLQEVPVPVPSAPASPQKPSATRPEKPVAPRPEKPAPSPSRVDSGVVDEIFHQATELFN